MKPKQVNRTKSQADEQADQRKAQRDPNHKGLEFHLLCEDEDRGTRLSPCMLNVSSLAVAAKSELPSVHNVRLRLVFMMCLLCHAKCLIASTLLHPVAPSLRAFDHLRGSPAITVSQ